MASIMFFAVCKQRGIAREANLACRVDVLNSNVLPVSQSRPSSVYRKTVLPFCVKVVGNGEGLASRSCQIARWSASTPSTVLMSIVALQQKAHEAE